ncbi:hypothetical protein [Streptomyces sp. NPDC037389]|uniref:hypothetical protein n=1 Tax=Streptomyces sp. NPDC037389 TaxID=3155369 RepID=UPI00340AFE58
MPRIEAHPADNDPLTRTSLTAGGVGTAAAPETLPMPHPSVYETPEFRTALRAAVSERLRERRQEIENLTAFVDAFDRLGQRGAGAAATKDSYPSAGVTSPRPSPAEG